MTAFGIGPRTLLAMTCSNCCRFLPGDQFERYRRKASERVQYVTRRCRKCRWQRMEQNEIGRNGFGGLR